MTWTNPRTWVAGETITAAMLNTHIRDQFNTIGAPWTTYTPTLSGWTLGNGTFTGSGYIKLGQMVIGRMVYTVGSTDTKSGVIGFSAPVTGLGPSESPIGSAVCFDTSATARNSRTPFLASTSVIQLVSEAGNRVTHLDPFTFATGDKITIQFQYEAA